MERICGIFGSGSYAITLSNPNVPGVILKYPKLQEITEDIDDARVYGGINSALIRKQVLSRDAGSAHISIGMRSVECATTRKTPQRPTTMTNGPIRIGSLASQFLPTTTLATFPRFPPSDSLPTMRSSVGGSSWSHARGGPASVRLHEIAGQPVAVATEDVLVNSDRNDLPVDTMPRLCMVGWYDPAQLFRTGLQVIVSTAFGRHSDARLLNTSSKPLIIDYRQEKYLDDDGCFGFDYVADTGDGWNSTYAVAYAVSQQHCEPSNHPPLSRGKLLILGGDLVYPYPTRQLYESRFVRPYSVAGQLHGDEPAEVLAIPGNHDWYDSLVNFKRLFCCQRMMGFRQTRQTRSYFAARLPANWWLFGVDVQLDGDLDESQFKFFSDVVSELEDDQRVILCMPEPVWHERWQRDDGAFHSGTLLEHLEKDIGDKLKVCIAGDLHHYQRHSTADNQHRITCGTGGAFLHPTHQIPSDPTGEFNHQRSFPDQEKSRRLSFLNLGFLARNPLFGIVPAIAYLLAAWQNGFAVGQCFGGRCIEEVGKLGLSQWPAAVHAGVNSALLTPAGFAIYALIFWGFVFFADRGSKRFCYGIGTLHAAAHVVAGFLIFWFGAYAAITWTGLPPKSVMQYLMTGAIVFGLGWIVGSLLLGIYLLASLNLFGMHRNDAFSSLRIEDWKGFLRFTLDPVGRLQMRFIGFEKVPRKWQAEVVGGRNILRPARKADLVGEVIDEIEIPGGPPNVTVKTPPRDAEPRLTNAVLEAAEV